VSAKINRRPVWAGIAIKLDDGTTYGFELDAYRLEAEIDIRHEAEDDPADFGAFRRRIPTGETFVDIRIRGRAQHSVRFSDAARDATVHQPAEIEPSIRAIEA